MNRRGFLRRIAFTGAAVVVAPTVLIEGTREEVGMPGLWNQMQASNVLPYEHLSLAKIEELMFDIANSAPQREYKLYTGKLGMEKFKQACRWAAWEL